MKTFTISEFILVGLNEEQKEELIKEEMLKAGFDLKKNYVVKKGYGGAGYVFEQKE